LASSAARQDPAPGQKLYFKIGLPAGQQPRVILPRQSQVELSALTMERDEASVMHLTGDAEIRLQVGNKVAVLRADAATYDLNTAEIQILSNATITAENAQ
jgi:hypothetical protein